MTKHEEGTWVTCDIFINFDYVYVYKKHAKNSIFICFGTYLHSKSCIQCFLRTCSFFFDFFLNGYIQINAAEYRRL